MLRERVLETWKGFKKSLLDDKKLLEALSSNLSGMKFDSSETGGGIRNTSFEVMEALKRKLPSITQACQELRNKYSNEQFGEDQLISDLWNLYLSYIGLVETYQKIIEYYDDSQSKGPEIEEVD